MDGLDIPGLLGRISERPAQIANAAAECGVAHGDVTPDGVEQRLLRDQSARVFDQMP